MEVPWRMKDLKSAAGAQLLPDFGKGGNRFKDADGNMDPPGT